MAFIIIFLTIVYWFTALIAFTTVCHNADIEKRAPSLKEMALVALVGLVPVLATGLIYLTAIMLVAYGANTL